MHALGIIADTAGVKMGELGTTTFRPPYTPLTFGTIVGRNVGKFFDIFRRTPMNDWHVEQKAEFENVGQWKRAWYYPINGETMHQAVQRESKAARESSGILDASTLGKIDIQGSDASEFLNRVYTNAWSKLGIGKCRYGLMLNEDGMVYDDGVTTRLGENHSLGSFLYSLVLSQKDLIGAVASILASKLHSDALSAMDIKKFILDVYRDCEDIEKNLEEDIKFFKDHDPACKYFSTPLLFYKGFLGLATYRAAHCLWNNERHTMALFFQNRASEVFGVDIHPAAKIAGAVMIDHATGVVIGETSEIESEVSIFQGSGGALGIGVGDRVLMLENTWYSVISPESCSSILWRSWEYKEQAAEALKLTATDMKKLSLIDEIVKEPLGGAHSERDETFKTVAATILKHYQVLKNLSPKDLVKERMDKYAAMGEFEG